MSLNEVYESLFTNLLIALIIITAHATTITCALGLTGTRLMKTHSSPSRKLNLPGCLSR